MKLKLIVIGFVLVMLATVVTVAQQQGLDRPAGVSADRWIPFNDQAGVVLADASPRGSVACELMVKVKGQWVQAYPKLPPPRITPLQAR